MPENALDSALSLYEARKRKEEEAALEKRLQSQQALKAEYEYLVKKTKRLLVSSGITEDIQKSMDMNVYQITCLSEAKFVFHYKNAEIRFIASDTASGFYGFQIFFKGGLKKYKKDLREDLSDAFFSSVKEIDRVEKLGAYAKLIAWRETSLLFCIYILVLLISLTPTSRRQQVYLFWSSLIPASATFVSACRHRKINDNPEWE